MFHVPKNAVYRRIGRRRFLELGGGAATALGAGSIAVGLNSMITRRPAYAQSSDDAKWKQYSGSKLVFMSENTPPSFAIRDNLKTFYDLTGIEVEILTDDLPVVQQKVGIDLRGGKADFQLNYVQDKPIGAPFADFYADLTQYIGDDTLPQDPDGDGRRRLVRELPDRLRPCTTQPAGSSPSPMTAAVACTFYRQDLFEQLTQGLRGRTRLPDGVHQRHHLEEPQRVRRLLQEGARRRARDVPYGYAQHQGSFAWTTQLDIQRMLFAHGRWTEFDIDDKLGSKDAGADQVGRRAVGADHGEVQGAGRRLPPRQPRQRHARAEHGLPGRPDRDAGAVSRVRGLDRGREDLARGRRQDGLCALPEGRGVVDQEWRPGGQRLQLRHRRHRHQRQRLGRPEARRLHLRDLGDLARRPSSTCSRGSAARRPASRCWRSRTSRRRASGRPPCRTR